MLLKFGVDVLDHDSKKVGTLESVIIDPATKEITELIIQKGFLFTRDKLVPISLVADGNQERVLLHEFEGVVENLRDYQETHYVPVENYINDQVRGEIIPLMFYAPLSTTRSHASQLTSIPVVKENLPAEKESLREGMEVHALDGENVGSVKEIILQQPTDRVTHLLISEGILVKREVLIPVEWIKEVKGSQVDLYLGSEVIEKLPEYEPDGLFT